MTERQTPRRFCIVITRDFYLPNGALRYRDIGLGLFQGHDHVEVIPFAEHRNEIGADQLAGAQAAIVLSPLVTKASLADSRELLAIGRFGVGYDSVDVPACTAADVLLFIAAGAVDYSVAEATLGWMLALAHQVRRKDALVREGRWEDRGRYMGSELRERTLGIIGLGGIGRALVKLIAPFGMNPPLAYDPWVNQDAADRIGVRMVDLNTLLKTADFVSVHCPLTETTRNLLGARELALMKPTTYLLNTARGGIVNEDALYAALKTQQLAGAAIDCFADEPLTGAHRFGEFDNVLLAPHCIAWTDEIFRDIGRTVCQGMLDLSRGRQPRGVINAEVLQRPSFQQKWAALRL